MNTPEFTHWRSVATPMTPLDPVGDTETLHYQPGVIPTGFVVLMWNGATLFGPAQFKTPEDADAFRLTNNITKFIIIPKPHAN